MSTAVGHGNGRACRQATQKRTSAVWGFVGQGRASSPKRARLVRILGTEKVSASGAPTDLSPKQVFAKAFANPHASPTRANGWAGPGLPMCPRCVVLSSEGEHSRLSEMADIDSVKSS